MGPEPGDLGTEASAALARVLTRRIDALRAHAEAAREGTVEGVHQARVATRRLREAVPVAAAGLRSVRRKRIRRALRTLTRALGPVRDCDVVLLLIAGLESGDDVDLQALRQTWTREVLAERGQRRRSLRRALAPPRIDTLSRAVAALASARAAATEQGWRRRLAARLDQRARRLRQRIDEAGPLFVPDRLHAVRIAGKQLRYALELADECRLAAVGPLLARLKRNQDTLGRLQDLDTLLGRLQRLDGAGDPYGRVQQAAEHLAGHLDREMRQLHAAYLRRRDDLIGLADHARDEVVPRVRGA
jgi:CHAD domain-containing protein